MHHGLSSGKSLPRRAIGLGIRAACLLFCWVFVARAAESVTYHGPKNRLDVQADSVPLGRLLENLAVATGWEIYLEPETEQKISAKFQNLPVAEALQLVLGKLNFALLPQLNAPPRLYVYRTSVQDATLIIAPPRSAPASVKAGRPIPNELLVTLKADAKESIDALARRLGAKVTGRADSLRTYRLQFDTADDTQAARDQLAADNNVEAVNSNYQMATPGRMDNLALSSPGALGLRLNAKTTANGLVVGLIDSAVQAQGSGLDQFLLPSISVAGKSQASDSSPTHGTAMAETILSAIAKSGDSGSTGVRILPVDVYGPSESTTTFDVANGIAQAVNSGAKVINLSLGSDGDSTFLHQVITDAAKQGVMFIAAAGNVPTTTPTYPAAYPEVIAVTAGSRSGLASYANRGDFVAAVAPGTSIIGFQDSSYLVTGTSASTATFTGWLVGRTDASGKPLTDVKTDLLQTFSPKNVIKP